MNALTDEDGNRVKLQDGDKILIDFDKRFLSFTRDRNRLFVGNDDKLLLPGIVTQFNLPDLMFLIETLTGMACEVEKNDQEAILTLKKY